MVKGLMTDMFNAYYDCGHRDCASLIARHYKPLPKDSLTSFVPCGC